MTAIVLIAVVTPPPGHYDEVYAAIAEVVPLVHQEAGCAKYALHRDGDSLVLIEKWETPADLAGHSQAGALKGLRQRLDGKLERAIDVRRLEPLSLGALGQGEL